jgi:hypothetical protein
MRLIKATVLFIGLFILIGAIQIVYEISYRLIFGKASYSAEAVFKVPHADVEIILERRCIHLFLAEYERALVVRADGKEVLRKEAAADTGGYSRMNVYEISPTEYFLSGDLSGDRYELDIARQNINSGYLTERPAGAIFVGSFDREENKAWRFITAKERAEQPSKIEKYKEHR